MRRDPIPEPARRELRRLGERWRTLPLAQASSSAPLLRGLAERYAEEIRRGPGAGPADPAAGSGTQRLPDLGPAVAYDQLVVLTYDVSRHRATHDPERLSSLAEDLATLRRGLDAAAPGGTTPRG